MDAAPEPACDGWRATMKGTYWVCAVLILTAACGNDEKTAAEERPLTPVTAQAVEEYSGEGALHYSGSIEPMTRVDVAFRASGYVQEILSHRGVPVQEGAWVKRGDVLARIRSTDYDARVNQAKSGLEQAQAGLQQAQFAVQMNQVNRAKAEADWNRASRLFQAETITKPDYEAAKAAHDAGEQNFNMANAQVEAAKARIAGAKAAVAEAEAALRDCAVTAPIDGIVYKRMIEPGVLVNPGVPAFTIADTSSVKVVFGAPDLMLSKLNTGRVLPVETEALPDARFPGRISRIAPAADPKTRVFDVELTIPNTRNLLKPGMIASVIIQNAKPVSPVPVVPLTAVVRSNDRPDGYATFVVQEQNGKQIVRRRDVSLGEAFGNRIGVIQGLRPGESVVVTGAMLIKDGDLVRVVPQMPR